MPAYELYDHAGEVPLRTWKTTGVEVPIFDIDGTLTSYHGDDFINKVVLGLLGQEIDKVYPRVGLVSNTTDTRHVNTVAHNLEETLGVNVYTVCEASGRRGHPSKPNPTMGFEVAWHYGVEPSHLGVIGDRRLVDVQFGLNLGARAIALCKKVGTGDAGGVAILRRLEATIVNIERISGKARSPSKRSV